MGPQLRGPKQKGAQKGPFSSDIVQDGGLGPIFEILRGPEIWSYATDVLMNNWMHVSMLLTMNVFVSILTCAHVVS